MRYKELKYDGEIYTDKTKIDSILIDNNFHWMLDAEIENARLEITKDTLIWNAGLWYNGDWKYGVFRHGEWRSGYWINGVWYNGVWKDGLFNSGIIFNGKFIKGEIRSGKIKGGKFYDIKFGQFVDRLDKKSKENIQDEEEIGLSEVQLENKIFRFNQFLNERLTEDEINSILDKKSKGIRLSTRDKLELKNFDKDFDYNKLLIDKIKDYVNKYGSINFPHGDTPIFTELGDEMHLIDGLLENGKVSIIVNDTSWGYEPITEYTINLSNITEYKTLEDILFTIELMISEGELS